MLFVSTIVAGLLARPAHARATPAKWREPNITLTFDTLQLIFPIVELQFDVRATRRISVVAIAGLGSVIQEGGERAEAWALGGQFRYYAIGDFRHGFQLGAEILHIQVGGDMANTQSAAAGLSVAAFAGYKYTTSVGFTVVVQAGPQVVVVPRENSMGESTDSSRVGPLVNLHLGWSF